MIQNKEQFKHIKELNTLEKLIKQGKTLHAQLLKASIENKYQIKIVEAK